MVRLRCCNHWLHEYCLSKSVLDDCCPTCRIRLTSLNDVMVLSEAASTGDILKVKELLERDTCCTAQDFYGRALLHLAVLFGHEEVVKELLDHGVDISISDLKGRAALHLAAQRYSPDILRLLLERRADIAARDCEDYLVEKGAKRDAKTEYDLTPEMLHPHSAYSEAMRLLSQ
ncbi:ankyrin [Hyaloscypha bicolor E]|uniref:Ankyrin n=1 Tax=Hyaloscypha bicolor E TaxID=1095630 RepID=A0A2J6SPG2_9HELO|nr:ankyrin [Hyaloscypha bicolor E]PMD52623.1 ankyrin [Hyaloscypha bicolor E]